MKILLTIAALMLTACAQGDPKNCRQVKHAEHIFTVCSFDASEDIRLSLTHADDAPIAQFDRLTENIASDGKSLAFAMNAGMYHPDRSPVGLYIEDGEQIAPVITREGPGNFGMLPNGIFAVSDTGAPLVMETNAYIAADMSPRAATQSGPMLVIDGALHPKSNPDGTSRRRRNGVGVSADGAVVHFAISEGFVTFHEFATLFRDELETPNALYLDGRISRLYAPELGRNEGGLDMGPIVSVVR